MHRRVVPLLLSTLFAAGLPLADAAAGEIWSQPTETKQWSQPTETKQWSQPSRTQQWSAPGAAASAPTHRQQVVPTTKQWAPVVRTPRRSDAEIQREVDATVARARRDAARGTTTLPNQTGRIIPDQVWQDHVNRTRADQKFQREQDEYLARQRYYQGR